jgi:hypothetical protein
MRFAVTVGAYGSGRDPRGLARLAALAEESGWDGMFLEDYLVYQGMTDGPTYDTWICLAAVTLDHLSGGRLILGVGAGDLSDPGFAAVGLPTSRRVRAERLDEGLAVIAALWSGEPVHHAGPHYLVDGLRLVARPVQRPRIPIWVGGDLLVPGVRRRLLRWDGACVYKGGDQPVTPDDIRGIRDLVAADRGTTEGFDIRVSGGDPAAFAAAGATWSTRWIPPGDAEATTAAVLAGPPTMDS